MNIQRPRSELNLADQIFESSVPPTSESDAEKRRPRGGVHGYLFSVTPPPLTVEQQRAVEHEEKLRREVAEEEVSRRDTTHSDTFAYHYQLAYRFRPGL